MNLMCPKCMSESAIKVSVEDGDTLTCPECEEEFSLNDVIALIESWKPILPWLLSHPARQEQEETATV